MEVGREFVLAYVRVYGHSLFPPGLDTVCKQDRLFIPILYHGCFILFFLYTSLLHTLSRIILSHHAGIACCI